MNQNINHKCDNLCFAFESVSLIDKRKNFLNKPAQTATAWRLRKRKEKPMKKLANRLAVAAITACCFVLVVGCDVERTKDEVDVGGNCEKQLLIDVDSFGGGTVRCAERSWTFAKAVEVRGLCAVKGASLTFVMSGPATITTTEASTGTLFPMDFTLPDGSRASGAVLHRNSGGTVILTVP